jgi:hypothetical protein
MDVKAEFFVWNFLDSGRTQGGSKPQFLDKFLILSLRLREPRFLRTSLKKAEKRSLGF